MLFKKRPTSVLIMGMIGAALLAYLGLSYAQVVQTPLAATSIPQFVEPLPIPEIIDWRGNTAELELHMREFKANILPTGTIAPGVKPETWVWGYISGPNAPTAARPTYLGPIIVTERGTPTKIRFVNNLGTVAASNVLAYTQSTDQTLHWADPLNFETNMGNMSIVPGMPPMAPWNQHYNGPIPAVVHLHGGEVPPELDGGPDAWFTSDGAFKGHGYYSYAGAAGNEAIYVYPNTQEASPIWFHDHTLGATRLNVYAGLAGGYLVTDPANDPANLPGLVPLIIQDRMFDTTGQLFFPNIGINPEHPFWIPEFLGDVICVNGKAWPFFNVEPKRYRFLFLNGSNARTYEMSFKISGQGKSPTFWQIATDGGYLDAPAAVQKLILMPGERADVILDFAGFAAGTTMILENSAKSPYPGGTPPKGATVGRVMQFKVVAAIGGADTTFNPALGGSLRSPMVRLVNPTTGTPAVAVDKTRQLTLNEVMGMRNKVGGIQYPGGPLEILVNNTKWSGESARTYNDFTPITVNGITTKYSELPQEGDTEVWEIVNLTADAHPMHWHLVQFQLLNRQSFDLKNYTAAYNLAFPGGLYIPDFGPPLNYNTGNTRALGGNPDITPFLMGASLPPAANEVGWKDTIMVPPGMVTRIVVRWAPTDLPTTTPKSGLFFPFDPSDGFQHGYVWHCHIIDHEDNEMMRPDVVQLNPAAPAPATRLKKKGVDY
jgi:FtsP/CotA-like multicopper oxidase with cupredoxin domain